MQTNKGRGAAVTGTAVFFFLAPFVVAGVVPWWISGWNQAVPLHWVLRFAGLALVAAGTLVLLDSFVRFALQGLGTPAPIYPTRYLVVSGLYHYVRNPMYVAVIAVVFGQSLLLGNKQLAEYGAVVWMLFHLFVVVYEEPTLRKKYGQQYDDFCRKVPRWIPRLTPG